MNITRLGPYNDMFNRTDTSNLHFWYLYLKNAILPLACNFLPVSLITTPRLFSGPASILCRFGGNHCLDGKVCRKFTEESAVPKKPERRRCVFPEQRKHTPLHRDRLYPRPHTSDFITRTRRGLMHPPPRAFEK